MSSQQAMLLSGSGEGDFYDGSGGNQVTEPTIGGIKYRVHTFTSNQNFTITKQSSDPNLGIDCLVVAGGGAGGGRHGGGGGGGGVVYVQGIRPGPGSYGMVIGGGATYVTCDCQANQGGNSTAFGETAIGGGGGSAYGQNSANCWKQNGGSGAGEDSRYCTNPGSSTQGNPVLPYGGSGTKYGNPGGQAQPHRNGGGGGAGAAGTDPHGGNGIQINIDGNNWYWAGGGGGGMYNDFNYAGNGGLGGGGGGSAYGGGKTAGSGGGQAKNNGSPGGSGTDTGSQWAGNAGQHTGGGGGGVGQNNWSHISGARSGTGAYGIVIVRYRIA